MLVAIGICIAVLALSLLLLAALAVAPLAIFPAALALAMSLMVFWIWMLVSAIQNKGLTDGEKPAGCWALFFHRAAKTKNAAGGAVTHE